MPTAPTPHTPLPAAPDIANPLTFEGLADPFVMAQETFGDQMDALATNAYNNAVEANADAIATAADAIATAADRVQTGLDRTAAEGAASTSAGWSATSTTSMAMGTGAKTLTIQTGKQFGPNTDIKVSRTSAPTTIYGNAVVDGYISGTGELTFTITSAVGSGTFTDWTVKLSGEQGPAGTGVSNQAVGFTLSGGTTAKTLTVDIDGTVSDFLRASGGTNADIVALALEVATLKGSSMGLSSGVSDAFEDAAGVDATASTGETYDSTNDLYSAPPGVESAESLPAMTSATTPSGHVITGPGTFVGAPWNLFDQATTYYLAPDAAVPVSIGRQTPTALTLAAYALGAPIGTGSSSMPAAFQFQGSNDGSSWTTLDTQTGQTWSANQRRVFTIPTLNRGSYTHHRLLITTAGSGATNHSLGDIEFLQLTYSPMSLRSVAYTALSAPATAMVTVAADLNGGAVNTDLIAYASRDNGTTWTAITLTATRALADGTTIYSGTGSIAAQPSGTSMKWRVDTSDDFDIQASAVVLQWS